MKYDIWEIQNSLKMAMQVMKDKPFGWEQLVVSWIDKAGVASEALQSRVEKIEEGINGK